VENPCVAGLGEGTDVRHSASSIDSELCFFEVETGRSCEGAEKLEDGDVLEFDKA
jgi:hypothetical protein